MNIERKNNQISINNVLYSREETINIIIQLITVLSESDYVYEHPTTHEIKHLDEWRSLYNRGPQVVSWLDWSQELIRR